MTSEKPLTPSHRLSYWRNLVFMFNCNRFDHDNQSSDHNLFTVPVLISLQRCMFVYNSFSLFPVDIVFGTFTHTIPTRILAPNPPPPVESRTPKTAFWSEEPDYGIGYLTDTSYLKNLIQIQIKTAVTKYVLWSINDTLPYTSGWLWMHWAKV